MNFQIKSANVNDVPLILQFIKELAEYEKLLHEVLATEASLKETLFGARPYAEVLIGYLDENPVSIALFFHNYSTFLGKPGIYLEDLYVKPEMRGQRIGYQMLQHLAKLAKERGAGRIEWSVLDWNSPAIDFYHQLGAKPMDEWTVFRLTGKELDALSESSDNERI